MSPELPDNSEDLIKEYLAESSIMIVDSMGSSRMSLASALSKLGASKQNMMLVSSISEARQEIINSKPKLVLSNFMVGDGSGLDLLQETKQNYSPNDLKRTIFVLVTSEASQSVVAQAAEEDVDTFIVRPYTIELLRKTLYSVINQKLNPSRYFQLIDSGKEALFKSNFDEAIEIFEAAMSESERPTLACFYAGQAEFMKSALQSAEKDYTKGLSYNKIHYKCLVGLHHLLMSQQKYDEAYGIIRRVAQYFPANPKRLGSVLRLAVLTENFKDMEEYYQIFIHMSERTEEMTRYMCSALVVTGKFYLREGEPSRALHHFNSAAISAAGRTQFLTYIVEALLDFKMEEEAKPFLERMGKRTDESKENYIANFLESKFEKL